MMITIKFYRIKNIFPNVSIKKMYLQIINMIVIFNKSNKTGEFFMEIILSTELEKIIEYKVSSGCYQNASEFIREAVLRTLEQDQLKLSKLNEAVSIGIKQAEKKEFSKRSVQDIIDSKDSGK